MTAAFPEKVHATDVGARLRTSPTVSDAPSMWGPRVTLTLTPEPVVFKVEPAPKSPRYLNRQERRALAAKQRRKR